MLDFVAGELLRIAPVTTDDPFAREHAGEHVRFLRYSPAGYAIVEFDDRPGRRFHFHIDDLTSNESFRQRKDQKETT